MSWNKRAMFSPLHDDRQNGENTKYQGTTWQMYDKKQHLKCICIVFLRSICLVFAFSLYWSLSRKQRNTTNVNLGRDLCFWPFAYSPLNTNYESTTTVNCRFFAFSQSHRFFHLPPCQLEDAKYDKLDGENT